MTFALLSWTRKALGLIALVVLALAAPLCAKADPVISVGSFPVTPPPSYLPTPPAGTFLVPVDISGASNLQTWQFDLVFDSSVVQQVDPGDGSFGTYGAQFTPGDPNSMSNILASGFLIPGDLMGVAGSYPTPPFEVSGDGVLAFILFDFLSGQEENNPDFSIQGAVTFEAQVPEPGTLPLLLVCMLVLFTGRVWLRRGKVRISGLA